jgi:Putative peptidoglycan binding domain
MKYGFTLFLLTVLAGSLALPQSNTTLNTTSNKTPKTTNTTKKAHPASTQSAARAPNKKSSAKKTVASKKGKSAKKPAVAAATWQNRQLAPTPDRYREIQQALIDKGYLKSEASGVWDAQSADALRQFQTDQKLSPTGKLSAASLIALGLGPKTSADSVSPPPVGVDSAPAAAIETSPPAPAPAN